MARPPNPAFEGLELTEQEKRAMYARIYRARNLEEQREYQRDYQREYNQDPVKVLARIELRIEDLVRLMEKKTAAYDKIMAPLQGRLNAMMMRQMEVESLMQQNKLVPPTPGRGRPRKAKPVELMENTNAQTV